MHAARRLQVRNQSDAATADTVRVRFSTHFQAAFGESLKVVGSSQDLGVWDIAAAPNMSWTNGHIWALDLELPEGADFEYKIVHVHYNGTSWEGCQNRRFQAGPALPDQAALHISCAFNYSETVVRLLPLDALPTLGSGEDDWDPAAQGLPADITEQLSQTGTEQIAEAAAKPSWADVQRDAPLFQTEAAVAVKQAAQDATAQDTAQEPAQEAAIVPEKVGASGAGAAAGAVALALGAGVVMSALAIDLTDAAVASAILAAGATFLPAKDAKDARQAVSNIMSGGLNVTEAIARGFGLRSQVEQRAEREAALKAAPTAELSKSASGSDDQGDGEQLTASLAEGQEQDQAEQLTDSALTLGAPSAGVLLGMTATSAEKALADSLPQVEDRQEVAH